MVEINIRQTQTTDEKAQLDTLLWEVLWQPLDMPRDTRDLFRMDCPEVEFVAMADGVVVGGLVIFRLGRERVDIRQLAVRPEFQNRGIGVRLMDALLAVLQPDAPVTVEVVVRSPALRFYENLGFIATGFCPEHPDFARNGITLHEMVLEIK
jgi:ribosomal protein S18 acetylase RimI-like enzyme